MKDHVEKDHLTKSDVVMLSIDQGMDLQTPASDIVQNPHKCL